MRRRLTTLVLAALLLAGPTAGQDDPELVEGKVATKLDRGSDAAIAKRLRATFEAFDSLEQVEVEVVSGVVRLQGQVDSVSARELAGKLARQVEGVSAVDNEIEETRSLARRLSIALGRLEARTWELVESLPLLAIALAVLALAVLAARAYASLEWPFRWLSDNVFLRNLARQVARVVIVTVGALLALDILDATALVGAILGAAGVVGLAVGFAFRDLVENYIASILLSIRQPFAPNDHVRIEGQEGKVALLTSRATLLVTFDGNHVRIPNSLVFKSVIENFSRKPERRFSFVVGVGNEVDLSAAQDLGLEVLGEMQGVMDDPGPIAVVESLGDSSVSLRFFGWVDQRVADFGKVRSEAIRLVKQAFDGRGVEMPEPIQRVRVETWKPTEAAGAGAGAAPLVNEARDVAPDLHLDAAVEEERRDAESDLLDEGSARE